MKRQKNDFVNICSSIFKMKFLSSIITEPALLMDLSLSNPSFQIDKKKINWQNRPQSYSLIHSNHLKILSLCIFAGKGLPGLGYS